MEAPALLLQMTGDILELLAGASRSPDFCGEFELEPATGLLTTMDSVVTLLEEGDDVVLKSPLFSAFLTFFSWWSWLFNGRFTSGSGTTGTGRVVSYRLR